LAKKIWISNKRFRAIQDELDRKGIYTEIIKYPSGYWYALDFMLVKVYKSRESARRAVVRLFNKQFPFKEIKIRKYGTAKND
jgi:hypothetical protein